MEYVSDIPLIDFSKFSLDVKEEEVSDTAKRQLADQICDAFRNVGFIYVKNHGIEQSLVDKVHSLAKQFFDLSPEIKQKYNRPGKGASKNYGFAAEGREWLNQERQADVKESFDFQFLMENWPNEEIADFENISRRFLKDTTTLADRILYLMGVGLHLEDPNIFRNSHNPDMKPTSSCARMAYYPANKYSSGEHNQIGCGEHTDNGTISLLFQDDTGGLEVRNKKGEYVPAKPVPGAAVVNVGDLMQRWTSDELVSTWHRVLRPSSKSRISVIYFAHPDEDVLVECLDGSQKYDPIKAIDYVNLFYAGVYSY